MKTYNIQFNVGKVKYLVNYHDGEKKHKDGSPFFDVKTFKNKQDLSFFTWYLEKRGFVKS